MKNLLNKFLILFLVPMFFGSCVNSNYDLNDIDDSGGLNPALALPVGSLNINVTDFLEGTGIDSEFLETGTDTIYIVYRDSMSLAPTRNIPGLSEQGVIDNIPPGLEFAFAGGETGYDFDVFKDLESSGSVLRPANPTIKFTIASYIGADIDLAVRSIASHRGNTQSKPAVFAGGAQQYLVPVGSAPEPGRATVTTVTFDKINGQLNELFAIAPDRITYNCGVNLNVPDDDKRHFLVANKFVDIKYEIRIPLTFSGGTQLASADTLEFDLSGDDFVSSLDEFALWIDYENRLRTTADLEIVFLDKDKRKIEGITKTFNMNAAASDGANQQNAAPAKNSLYLDFKQNEIDDAKKTQYVKLNYILKTGNREVNIHPSDYIKLKLSVYLKVNI
jgi:hypothetical protein